MKLAFSPADEAFRLEVRAFVQAHHTYPVLAQRFIEALS